MFAPTAEPADELPPLDIAAYRGRSGVDHVIQIDSFQPGPAVVVNALTHGNELCGLHAVDFLIRIGLKPQRGRLSFSLANVEAYGRYDTARPSLSRFVDEDLNRVWAPEMLGGARTSSELRRARALRPVFDAADYLIDLHSMQQDGPPLLLTGRTRRAGLLARALGSPGWIIRDDGHVAGRRLIDYGAFADPEASAVALLVECGQHRKRTAAAVAVETTLRFLVAVGTVDRETVAPYLASEPPVPQRVVEVTHVVTAQTDGFRFVRNFDNLETVPEAGTAIAVDGGETIATPYDDCVLVMPIRTPGRGLTAVRLGRESATDGGDSVAAMTVEPGGPAF